MPPRLSGGSSNEKLLMAGGVFTDGLPNIQTVRDKEVPGFLCCDLPKPVGFVASDVLIEQAEAMSGRLEATEVMVLSGLRMALAVRRSRMAELERRLMEGGPMRIATSYPRTAQLIGRRYGFNFAKITAVGGQTETVANLLPQTVDAVVDIVKSGRSMERKGLVRLRDNLLPLSLFLLRPVRQ